MLKKLKQENQKFNKTINNNNNTTVCVEEWGIESVIQDRKMVSTTLTRVSYNRGEARVCGRRKTLAQAFGLEIPPWSQGRDLYKVETLVAWVRP